MKKAIIIIVILLIVVAGFFYVRQRNTTQNGGTQSSGFKGFFNFGNRTTGTTDNTKDETTSDFTGETPVKEPTNGTPTTPSEQPNSAFGNTPPLTITNGGTISGTITPGIESIEGSGFQGGASLPGGGTISGGGTTGGGTGGTGGVTGPQCGVDDLEIEFTAEEIAKLKALETRFYAIAPTLRTNEDLQAESANYSSYKVLNQKYTELITYCENVTPLLPSALNQRVATPLYSDPAQDKPYFTTGANVTDTINIATPGTRPGIIEKLFRISIW